MADNKIWGYSRVSTHGQNIERQLQIIKDYAKSNNMVIDRIFEEEASGRDFESRPRWQSLKDCMRGGDLLIITELDRLGRNMSQIQREWRELEEMGVDVVVIENPLLSTANKTDIEKKLISEIVFSLLSYVVEKEREKLRSRQAEGIAIAKANGKYKGRKPIDIDEQKFARVYAAWRNAEITAVKAMALLGLKKDVFYRKVKGFESKALKSSPQTTAQPTEILVKENIGDTNLTMIS